MYYSEQVLQEVRDANNIVDVISSYVPLQKKGTNHFGLCPFHGEKTASFSVNERDQYYYCFGCHASGNVITFLMKMDNLTFVEAVEQLAERAHIRLPAPEASAEEKKRLALRERMTAASKETALYYYYQLRHTPPGKRALQYLEERSVSETYQKRFGLGYAPVSGSGLAVYLKSKGFDESELLEAGLLAGKAGGTYDRFFNRLMFPIFNTKNEVIAFGGRILGEGNPKYLNSSDSLLFNKRRNLYGLQIARRSKRPYLIMVEGYMDVISLHQAGFDSAVATLGTALTPEQAGLIRRYADEVVLCYDSDGAGTQAARRGIPILEKAGLKIRVMQVPSAKDPDEFIKEHGAEAFEALIEGAMDPMDFELQVLKKLEKQSAEGEVETAHAMARRLAEIESEVDRTIHIRRMAEKLKIPEKAFLEEVEEIRRTFGTVYSMEERQQARASLLRNLSVMSDEVLQLAAVLLQSPEVFEEVKSELSLEQFSHREPFYRTMMTYLFEHLEKGETVSLAGLLSCYADLEEQERAGRALDFSKVENQADAKKQVRQLCLKIKGEWLRQELETEQSKEDPDIERLSELTQQIKAYPQSI